MARGWTSGAPGRSRLWLLLAAGIVLAAVVAGAVGAVGLPEGVRRQVQAGLVLPAGAVEPGPAQLPAALRRHMLEGAALAWFLGLSLLGLPFLWSLLFWRGFQLGFAAAFLWEWGGDARRAAFLALIPHNLLAIPALCVLVAAQARLSYTLLRSVWRGRPVPRWSLRRDGAAAVAATLLLLGASYVEAYLTPRLVALSLRLLP